MTGLRAWGTRKQTQNTGVQTTVKGDRTALPLETEVKVYEQVMINSHADENSSFCIKLLLRLYSN